MMRDTQKKLNELLACVVSTETREIDCDTFLNRAAAYVEHLDTAGELDDTFLEMAQHVKVCPECHEELFALLDWHRHNRP
jgi:hypothetical protein